MVNRVTDQVQAIHDATLYAIISGCSGMLISGVTLLLVLGGPMQRIQDVVHALPLMAEKSYVRLRYELPEYPDGTICATRLTSWSVQSVRYQADAGIG